MQWPSRGTLPKSRRSQRSIRAPTVSRRAARTAPRDGPEKENTSARSFSCLVASSAAETLRRPKLNEPVFLPTKETVITGRVDDTSTGFFVLRSRRRGRQKNRVLRFELVRFKWTALVRARQHTRVYIIGLSRIRRPGSLCTRRESERESGDLRTSDARGAGDLRKSNASGFRTSDLERARIMQHAGV